MLVCDLHNFGQTFFSLPLLRLKIPANKIFLTFFVWERKRGRSAFYFGTDSTCSRWSPVLGAFVGKITIAIVVEKINFGGEQGGELLIMPPPAGKQL